MTVTLAADLDPATLKALPDAEFFQALERIKSVLPALPVEHLGDLALRHPEWMVRKAAVEALGGSAAESGPARRYIADASHDPVDWVAFTSIQIVDKYRIREAIDDMVGISGWPSHFTRPGYKRKPVGCGAAFTKHAMLSIFGTSDPKRLWALELEHLAPQTAILEQHARQPDLRDAVLVEAGEYQAGGPPMEDAFQMDSGDNHPRTDTLDAFYIDRHTVTNARYKAFLESVGTSKMYAHPDEPPAKDYTPAHWRDPRFNRPEHPVVGVDWYDAYAFATWSGGFLPSEQQWEKAARGTDGRLYPWGAWEPSRANYVERSMGQKPKDLAELEALLRTCSLTHPAQPVLPSNALPESASPYGCIQMSGNVWEMTRTNFFSREDMDPFFKGRHPREFMNRRDALYVIRGGAFTSPRICLLTYYRGKDLLTDRHNEIGFRCAYPAGPVEALSDFSEEGITSE